MCCVVFVHNLFLKMLDEGFPSDSSKFYLFNGQRSIYSTWLLCCAVWLVGCLVVWLFTSV